MNVIPYEKTVIKNYVLATSAELDAMEKTEETLGSLECRIDDMSSEQKAEFYDKLMQQFYDYPYNIKSEIIRQLTPENVASVIHEFSTFFSLVLMLISEDTNNAYEEGITDPDEEDEEEDK